MPREIAPGVLSWASELDEKAALQAGRTARMPFVTGHVALMADAHPGVGSTIGAVIPTTGAIIPACVGVDIGCGMVATRTNLSAADLPDDLGRLMPMVEERIPAGVGRGHRGGNWTTGVSVSGLDGPATGLTSRQKDTAESQFGTLGGGNHFAEVCLDERDRMWTVLHSGSRGIGNQLAQAHIKVAKGLMREMFVTLEDPDLAYLVQGSAEFEGYITDMLWAQRYAMASRQAMNRELVTALFLACLGPGYGLIARSEQIINCHHNFTQREHHNGRDMWITRKGAIKAANGDWGVIPGSMGAGTYIVTGLGGSGSYDSCSHGAGRRMSRSRAKRDLTPESLTEAMAGKTWNSDRAKALVDEHPAAYKDIVQVMEDQRDLARIEHTLSQVFNYKG